MPKLKWPLLALVMTFLAWWSAWTLWVLLDEDYRNVAPTRTYPVKAPEWRLIHGEGEFVFGGLSILRPNSRAEILILLDLPRSINSDRFEYIDIHTSGAVPAVLDLQWSVADHFSVAGQAPVEWLSPGHGRVYLNNWRGWEGQPLQLALSGLGFSGPWTFHSLELAGGVSGFVSLQRGLWQRLTQYEDWHFRNINRQAPPDDGLRVSFTALIAVWVVIAMAVLLYLKHLRLAAAWWLAVPLLIVWIALDARWQAEVLYKTNRSLQSYAGVPLAERGRLEVDSSLFEFTETLTQRHARHEFNRIFAVSDPYWSTRARYRLAQWGARSLPPSRLMNDAHGGLEVGDLVLAREDFSIEVVAIDPSQDLSRASDSAEPVRVQFLDGRRLVEGSAILNVGQHWAILVTEPVDQLP